MSWPADVDGETDHFIHNEAAEWYLARVDALTEPMTLQKLDRLAKAEAALAERMRVCRRNNDLIRTEITWGTLSSRATLKESNHDA